MIDRCTRRTFLGRSAVAAAGLAALPALGTDFGPTVASAHQTRPRRWLQIDADSVASAEPGVMFATLLPPARELG